MKPIDLANLAIETINNPIAPGAEPRFQLVLPPTKHYSEQRHIAGRGSPLARVLEERRDGDLVSVSAVDVLAWLVAMGVVEIAQEETAV